MKIKEVEHFTDLLMPRLYKYAFGLVPDGKVARELIADAYSVFTVREMDFINGTELPEQRKAQALIKRFFLMGILEEIYQLSLKKSFNIRRVIHQASLEYQSFYELSTTDRSVLILKERLNFTPEAIGQVMKIKKFQVVESLYNSREALSISSAKWESNATH
jgi:DNA-directed RNA polymerase specialized sigma24 family protein